MEFGSTLSRPVGSKCGDRKYLSPLVYENHIKMENNTIMHNPYKSDVYSLGIVLLEIYSVGLIDNGRFKEMLENRRVNM
jgi:hypothetical protein